VRDYWRGEEQMLGDFAYRLTGSSDLYATTGRRPFASVNFVTCHDGFTLTDLASYNEKHNEANGEDNRDGESHNRSWNCGVEGPTDDPEILERRARQRRNLLATLLLSQGVPMILSGDEIGRTQYGNNNAYCQDNEISWLDWDNVDEHLLEYTRWLVRFRNEHPVLHRARFFEGQTVLGSETDDIAWFRPDGVRMGDDDWLVPHARTIGVFLNGEAINTRSPRGERVVDDSFFIVFSAHSGQVDVTLPGEPYGSLWRPILDTFEPVPRPRRVLKAGARRRVRTRSVVLFRREQ
jgi:glycogen operon protein